MNDLTSPLFAALLRATLVLSVLTVAVLLLSRVLHDRSAGVRRCSICLALLLTWASAAVRIDVPWPGWWPANDPVVNRAEADQATAVFSADEPIGDDWLPTRLSDSIAGDAARLQVEKDWLAVAPPPNGSASAPRRDHAPATTAWLMAIWAGGVLLVAVRGMYDYLRLVRRLAADRGVVHPLWLGEWGSVQLEMLGCRWIPMEPVWGVGPLLLRLPGGYRLVVPAERWGGLPPEQRRAILRHEAAHVQRADVWKSLAVRVLVLPHWFNPLAWRVARLFDECAEWACDDAVRRSAPREAAVYARALLCLGAAEPQALLSTPAARGRGLALRIRRLLSPHDQEDSMMKKTIAVLMVTGLGLPGLLRFEATADERPGAAHAESSDAGGRISGTPLRAIDSDSAAEPPSPAASHDDRPQPPGDAAIDLEPADSEAEDVADKASAPRTPRQDITFVGDVLSASALDSTGGTEFPASRERQAPAGGEAVINMKRFFDEFEGFKRGRQMLRAEVDREARQAQDEQKAIADLQRRLKTVEGDDANARKLRDFFESELIERKVKFESRTAEARKRFLKVEAELYYSTYQQLTAEIRRYAREHGIRIVRRSDAVARDQIALENPREIMQLLNRDVVFIDEEPLDITDEILERLNRRAEAAGEDDRQ